MLQNAKSAKPTLHFSLGDIVNNCSLDAGLIR